MRGGRFFTPDFPIRFISVAMAAPTAASRTSSCVGNRSISPPVASRRGLKSSSSMQCHRKTSSAMTTSFVGTCRNVFLHFGVGRFFLDSEIPFQVKEKSADCEMQKKAFHYFFLLFSIRSRDESPRKLRTTNYEMQKNKRNLFFCISKFVVRR